MNWEFSKSKLSSGRFLLTVIAGLCFVLLTVTVSYVITQKSEELKVQDVLPYLSTILIILSNIFTFYFTKRTETGVTNGTTGSENTQE